MTFKVLAGPDFWCLARHSSWGSFTASSTASPSSSAVSTTSSAAGVTCSSHLEWDLFGFFFRGISLDPFLCSSCWMNSRKRNSFVNALEECNPVVLVLILTLVSVGRLPPELVVVKIDFASFLIIYSSFTNNYILEWATKGNDNVVRSFAQRFCFNFNRGTWVRMHEKTPGNGNPFPSHTETEFRFQDTETEFCFHSKQNFYFRITLFYKPQHVRLMSPNFERLPVR